jgi:hypothetical protein
MKKDKSKFLKRSILIVSASAIIFNISCEEYEDWDEDDAFEGEEEGYRSTSIDNEPWNTEGIEPMKPVLHMSCGPEFSKEECDAKWADRVQEYRNSVPEIRTAKVTFQVWTQTGTAKHAGTDGKVEVKLYWKDSVHYNEHANYYRLDKPNYNDFEAGHTDYFYWVHYHGQCLHAVTFDRIRIRLRGKDGWQVRHYGANIRPADNNGYSADPPWVVGPEVITNNQLLWLDNPTSIGWDRDSSTHEGGRFYFND